MSTTSNIRPVTTIAKDEGVHIALSVMRDRLHTVREKIRWLEREAEALARIRRDPGNIEVRFQWLQRPLGGAADWSSDRGITVQSGSRKLPTQQWLELLPEFVRAIEIEVRGHIRQLRAEQRMLETQRAMAVEALADVLGEPEVGDAA